MSSLTFNGFQIGGTGRDARLRRLGGAFSRALNLNSPNLPRYQGGLVGDSYESQRRPRVEFAITPDKYFDALEAFEPLVDEEKELTLDIDGLPTVVLFCRPYRAEIPYDELAKYGYAIGQVEFEASDPVFYDPTVTQLTLTPFESSGGLDWDTASWPLNWGAAGTGGTGQFSNSGKWETWPTFTISGPTSGTLTNPIIENASNGSRLALNANGGVSMTSGQSLIIDTHPARRSIAFDTGASRRGKLSDDSDWFPLLEGNTELRFRASGSTAGASCLVEARSARI